jgi:hypothetical protein
MKVQYVPQDDSQRGLAAPIVDAHDHWLVPPRFVVPGHPDCVMTLHPHQYITLHEVRDRHWIQFMRAHNDFVVVNSSPHPEAGIWR